MEFTFGFFGYFICTLVLQVACLLAANLVRVKSRFATGPQTGPSIYPGSYNMLDYKWSHNI